ANAVSSLRLGAIERLVGGPQERFRRHAVALGYGDPDRERHTDIPLPETHRRRLESAAPGVRALERRGEGSPRYQHHEFLAAPAADQVARAGDRAEVARDRA